MPGRGRPRKPTALKILEGNPTHESKDRLDLSREPEYGEAQKGAFRPPSCLSPAAKLEWKRVIKPLAKTRLYQVVDRGALAGYCENWSTFKCCQAFINVHGLTYQVTNRSGTFYNARPEVTLRDKALEQMRRFAQEFGFSPAARSRIEVPKVETKDLLREALSKPRVIQRPKGR